MDLDFTVHREWCRFVPIRYRNDRWAEDLQLDGQNAGDRGEDVVVAVLLGSGDATAAKVIIIRMDNKNGDGVAVTENPLENTEAAVCTKEELDERSQAEEEKQMQPGVD